MRIVVVGLRGIPDVIGGIETQCEQLYPAMVEADPGIEVHLYARSRHVAADRRTYGGVAIHRVWAPMTSGLEAMFHTLFCLIHARLFLSPDIVHLHAIGPAFWTPLARCLGLRTIVTHHAPDYERPKWSRVARFLLRFGEAMAARFAHHVICVSQSVHTLLIQHHPEAEKRANVIFNAVRPFVQDKHMARCVLEELGLTPSGYVIAVGRLDETKRFHDLIAAHARIGGGGGALPLVIVGASVNGDHYGALLRRSSHDGVIFAGFRTGTALAALYRNAALFIHPSEMEGFGLVVLEALGMGAPVMLSDIPPHREFGLPDRNYFPVGDVEAIAAALRTAPDRARDDHRAILSRYNLDGAVKAHLDLYRRLLPRTRPAAGQDAQPPIASNKSQ